MSEKLTPEEYKKTVETILRVAEYETKDFDEATEKSTPKVLNRDKPEDQKKIQDIFSKFKQ